MNHVQEKTMKSLNNYYMELAYKEALKAYKNREVPVGCVVVCGDKVVGKGHNKRERNNLAISHAEVVAINKANKKMKTWRLDDCRLYVTLEPCPMCAGAIIQARIKEVYFTAIDLKNGAAGSIINMFDFDFSHKVNLIKLDDNNQSSNLIKQFFKEVRTNKK